MITDILDEYELPHELKYLALSLSGCSNFEASEEGGTGFFLMRYAVAKNKGLHISSYVDERRDVFKATHVFAQEIKELYNSTGDWYLAIASFYATPLEMSRAISYSKDSAKQYWAAHSYLPFTYQKTVPKFIAAAYIANFYTKHNLKLAQVEMVELDTVPIKEYTTIGYLSEKLEVNYDLLKDLNPIYKKQVIPNSGKEYYLVLPANKVETFYNLGKEVYSSPDAPPSDSAKAGEQTHQPPPPPPQPAYTTIYYTVRSGDVLGKIADYYDTRVSSVKRWNNLRSDQDQCGAASQDRGPHQQGELLPQDKRNEPCRKKTHSQPRLRCETGPQQIPGEQKRQGPICTCGIVGSQPSPGNHCIFLPYGRNFPW